MVAFAKRRLMGEFFVFFVALTRDLVEGTRLSLLFAKHLLESLNFCFETRQAGSFLGFLCHPRARAWALVRSRPPADFLRSNLTAFRAECFHVESLLCWVGLLKPQSDNQVKRRV